MRAIIDSTGLPAAVAYYKKFPREPSATRNLDIKINQRDEVRRITMEAVLDRMLQAAKKKERDVLIVAHGQARGFVMPIARGGTSALRSALRIVMTAEAKIRRADGIRALPAAKRLAAWTKFINELAPGKIKGAFTVQQADDWFEKQWLPAQARRVRVCTATLKQLVRKMNSVRGARFRRIEVRACNMGADRTTLKALREFFGAARVLAPNVGTFYVLVRPFVPRKPQALQRWLRQYGGRAKGGVYRGRQGPATRSFDVHIASRHSMQAFLIPKGFHLRVWEISQTPHRYQARAAAAEWSHVKAWVDHNIMPLSSYRRGAFYLAGMWTFGKGRLPYAVPSEPEYRGRIVSQPP